MRTHRVREEHTLVMESPAPLAKAQAAGMAVDLATWKAHLITHLGERRPQALHAVLPALQAHPTDADLLLLAVVVVYCYVTDNAGVGECSTMGLFHPHVKR